MQEKFDEFKNNFEQSIEKVKQEQKETQDKVKEQSVQYDSWQIEMMHWGVHH